MAISAASHLCYTSLRALSVFSVFVLLVSDVGGRHHVCPLFSCGPHRNVSSPFRRQGDPSGCGVPSYELVCTDTEATISIGKGTYNVLSINYIDSIFWVADASLSMQSSCPLPRWDYRAEDEYYHAPVHGRTELAIYDAMWAIFMNCSQEVNDDEYVWPVKCLSTNDSFIYMSIRWLDFFEAQNFVPSCGYLAMTPLGTPYVNESYPYVINNSMRKGFPLRFPFRTDESIRECLALPQTLRGFREEPRNYQIVDLLTFDFYFWLCVTVQLTAANRFTNMLLRNMSLTIASAMWTLKCIHVLCRFVLVPLVVFIFLAHKYWKKRITIDAVEKFLRLQQMFVPTRYTYTDIVAITSHFREKLGQGGYGSVFKGVLLPGNVHVAIKMLGNTNCNGEDFISEVATIGKIHHVNVVRLIGFCSEETVRALVYEFMPRGSFDKYIFSSEKSFSWDKLNEIALGIARGINYLHLGCDMQIVHFDIKPHNILLDSNFIPKVADFGLAKLFPRDNNFVPLSAMRGTIGYIAPEMVSRSFGVVSSKSDVYSFGMLLLEMAGGRRNADPHAGSSSRAYYPSLVYSQLSREDVGEISEAVDMHELEKNLCIVGLWCIQMKPHDRPTMSEVIEMLENGVDGLQMPPRPFFCDDEVEGSYYMPSDLNAIQEDE